MAAVLPAGGGAGRPGVNRAPEPERLLVLEVWEPACLLAVRELKGIEDPDAFEEAALRWLESEEAAVAAEIAWDHGRKLLEWWHEEADDTPYGTTVVALGGRISFTVVEAAEAGCQR